VAKLGGLNLELNPVGFANPAATQAFFLQATAPNLTGLVECLKTTADAKTLASPLIRAVNGQESRLQVGEQLGFRVTTTTETSTLESVEFLNVGVVLSVIPQISRDGQVLMRIMPEVSSGDVNPDTGLPEEQTTELQTDVMLASGQGVVIGGLIKENDNVQAGSISASATSSTSAAVQSERKERLPQRDHHRAHSRMSCRCRASRNAGCSSSSSGRRTRSFTEPCIATRGPTKPGCPIRITIRKASKKHAMIAAVCGGRQAVQRLSLRREFV
jgi:hypothetical protein